MLKGWTTYHLSIVAVFMALMAYLGINALVMRSSGGYEISSEAILPYDADQLWMWVTENDRRSKWQVGMYDLSRLSGEPVELESSRMLFFQSGPDKWSGVEFTLEATAPVKWVSRQELPTTFRIYSISLMQQSQCQTKVIVHERAELYDFTERFWLFWTKREHSERLDYSLRQLETWMGHRGETCEKN